MPLTYDTQQQKDEDKALLDYCRVALDVTPSALRLDECELWELRGSRGRITTYGDGVSFLLNIFERDTKKEFTWAIKRLAAVIIPVEQRAELEGTFRFILPLDPNAPVEIRDLAGLRKMLSEERLASLRANPNLFGKNK